MNYLAHLALSNYNTDHLIGNFLTDLIKRDEVKNLSVEVQYGITMHNHIDGFTDSHALVLEAKSLIKKRSRRYAGILLDIYFDHLLIRHWNELYSDKLEDFITYSHNILAQNEVNFPEKAKLFSQRIRERDLLLSYSHIDGIRNALKGVDKRLKKPVGLDDFLDDILEEKEKIDKLFLPFYKDLQNFIFTQFHSKN